MEDVSRGRRLPTPGTHGSCHWSRKGNYSGLVLDLSSLELEEIANALADQTDYEHRWLIKPQTGEIAFWTADTGIDGQTPVGLDELDLVCIDPMPSWVWYLLTPWYAFRDARAQRRAVQWLADNSLISDDTASRFLTDHPDPDVP